MNKTAQVSLFILLGALIVVLFLFYYVESSKQPMMETPGGEGLAVRGYVQSCVDSAALEGVQEFGLTGGMPIPALGRRSAFINGRYVTIYRFGDDLIDIPLTSYQGYLAEYIAQSIDGCLGRLPIKVQELPLFPTVSTKMTEKGVAVYAYIPIKVSNVISETNIPADYSTNVDVNLLSVISKAKEWAALEKESGGWDLTRTAELTDQGYVLTLLKWDDNTSAVLIEDYNHKLENKNYAFQFATSGVPQ